MTVNITISGTSGSDSLADTVDLSASGSVEPGDDSDVQDLFIRHDAVASSITDCAFYATRYTGSSYLGEDPDDDFTEIMGWGDAATGGWTINQVIPDSWTTGQRFDTGDDQLFKNGYGDINSQLILLASAINIGAQVEGEIPVAGEAHVQVRFQVPPSVEGAGYRAIQLVMAYSATS
jgi:hypothetical protein